MGKQSRKRSLIVAGSILGVLLIAIGVVALLRAVVPSEPNPYVIQPESSTSQTEEANNSTDNEATTPNDSASSENEEATPATLDPSTISTVDIVPMGITVSYVKGIGGFEYAVLRASNGTRYVEFRSPQLISTKCTNDTGTFASIIASPTESERTGLADTTEVGGTRYGLSLADATCASDTATLRAYQKSFSDAFSLLKKL